MIFKYNKWRIRRNADAATVVVRRSRHCASASRSTVCECVSFYLFQFCIWFLSLASNLFHFTARWASHWCVCVYSVFAFINQSANIRLNYDFSLLLFATRSSCSIFDNHFFLDEFLRVIRNTNRYANVIIGDFYLIERIIIIIIRSKRFSFLWFAEPIQNETLYAIARGQRAIAEMDWRHSDNAK